METPALFDDPWHREIAIVMQQMDVEPWAKFIVRASHAIQDGVQLIPGGYLIQGSNQPYKVIHGQCECPQGAKRGGMCYHRAAAEMVKRCLAGGIALKEKKMEEAVPQETHENGPNLAEDDTYVSSYAHRTVYQAIAHVAARIAQHGVPKSRTNEQQKFRFRGIDDVQNALAPLLADTGLIILPKVIARDVTVREAKAGGSLTCVSLHVEYTFVEVSGGTSHTVTVCGEGMDSGDKATSKAMSAAYKYMAIQVFCIPVEGQDDADRDSYEAASRHTPNMSEPSYRDLIIKALEKAGKTDDQIQTYIDTLKTKYGNDLDSRLPGIYKAMQSKLAVKEEEPW